MQFISDPAADGLTNMALDRFLAEKFQLAPGESVLRLYQWSPAAYTIGRNQSWERALDLRMLRPGELAVRRITGGRAIFHDTAELTYAFAYESDAAIQAHDPALHSSEATFPKTRIPQLSAQIGSALCEFLKSLGLGAQLSRQFGRATPHTSREVAPHCFASVARHEITVGERKVAAGAQVVTGSRFFQHGSIKLVDVTGGVALYGRRVVSEFYNSSSVAMYDIGSDASRELLARAFAKEFESALRPIALSASERSRALGAVSEIDSRIGADSTVPAEQSRYDLANAPGLSALGGVSCG